MIKSDASQQQVEKRANNFESAVFRILETVEALQGQGPVSVDQLYTSFGDTTATMRLALRGNSLAQQLEDMMISNIVAGHLQGYDPHTSQPVFGFTLAAGGARYLAQMDGRTERRNPEVERVDCVKSR